MSNIDDDDVAMSVKEAARILGVSPQTVYRLCKSGELQHYRIRTKFTITPAQLQKYLKNHATPTHHVPEYLTQIKSVRRRLPKHD